MPRHNFFQFGIRPIEHHDHRGGRVNLRRHGIQGRTDGQCALKGGDDNPKSSSVFRFHDGLMIEVNCWYPVPNCLLVPTIGVLPEALPVDSW